MKTTLIPLLSTLAGLFQSRARLHLEGLALRQQLAMVIHRDQRRIHFRRRECLFWVWLYRLCPGCVDLFTVPTVSFRILYVLVVLRHERRQPIHFNVTEHPTSQWSGQRIVETFPWEEAPRFLLRNRDSVYGAEVRPRVRSLAVEEILTAPRSSWQNPYVERLIGSIRREILN